MTRSGTGSGGQLDRLAELEEQRRFLLQSLDDLDRERAAGDIDESDYQTLSDDYTARTAAVIRAIEAGEAALPVAPPASRRRRVLTVVAMAAFAAVAGVLVAQAMGERAPGEVASGEIRRSSSDRLSEARGHFQRGDLLPALSAYDAVLDLDPENTEALAYRGFLLVTAGSEADQRLDQPGRQLIDAGVELLDRAVALDPAYLDARVFRAMARLYVLDQPEAALEDVRAALDLDPSPEAVPRIAAIQQDIAERLGATGPESSEPSQVGGSDG